LYRWPSIALYFFDEPEAQRMLDEYLRERLEA